MRNVPKKPRSLVAALLAVAVHLALALFLIFGVRWQNKYPEPMMVELVPNVPAVPKHSPPAAVVNPPPEPPVPVAAPVVQPSPPLPPPPVAAAPKAIAKTEPPKVDIAFQARQEKERLDRQKKEQERLAQDKRERELRDQAKKETEKRERDAAKRDADRRSLEELKLAQDRARQEAEERQRREVQAQREREQREKLAAQEAAAKVAANRAHADYVNRIQSKIRGNVILPPEIAGNPEGVFDVIQLPTGEIISAEIRKSSGSHVYDDAVLRAILKSSPLPKPDAPALFERNLTLKFRPQE